MDFPPARDENRAMKDIYVIYEFYSEYNQFEGSWDKDRNAYDNVEKAETFVAEVKKNSNYRNIVGPLGPIKN